MRDYRGVTRIAAVALPLLFFLPAIALAQDGISSDSPADIVINDDDGEAASRAFARQFGAVVSLHIPGGSSFCTGSLISPTSVLTARHCLPFVGDNIHFGEDSANPDFVATVSSVIIPDPVADVGVDLLNGGDVAIVTLASPVPASVATPLRLTNETTQLVGEVAATVGYGFNGVGSVGHNNTADGFRWAGTNVIDAFGPPEPFAFFGENNIYSTDFDDGSAASNTIPGSSPDLSELEATTGPGDSGGPLLIQEDNGEWVIAGVLSGGTTLDSVFGDVSWWTGVAQFQAEIEAAGGVFVPVPEPTSLALVVLGSAAVAARRRQRFRVA